MMMVPPSKSAIISGMERPLISFCQLCHNQLQWIGAALEGAFAQTYRPLEIVISDDGSTDGSAEFIQEYIAAHAPPDVTVIYNRNPTNLGILGNWLKMASLSHGELLIKADGDDISLPDRAEKVAMAWVADGKRAAAVCHAGYRIDLDGHPLGHMPAPDLEGAVGALMAWRRDCYTAFSPETNHPRCVEDAIFARRAMMLDGALVIPDCLVKYRIGSGITSALRHHRTPAITGWRVWRPSLDQAERDLAMVTNRLSPERVEEFRRKFAFERARAENHLTLLESPSFQARWAAFRQEYRMGCHISAPFMLAYLLPRRIGDWVLDGITCLNLLRRRLRGMFCKR